MRLIFYDTETTGIRPDSDRIVEIAAYDPERQATFVHLVNPGIPIPLEAAAIHGISDEMVKTCPGFAEVGREFMQFCEGQSILIAHNNDAFDLPFLRYEYARSGLTMPAWQ